MRNIKLILLILIFLIAGCAKNYKGKDEIAFKEVCKLQSKYERGTTDNKMLYEEILKSYRNILKNFPKSSYTPQVKKNIIKLNNLEREINLKEKIEERKKSLNKLIENGYKGISWGTPLKQVVKEIKIEKYGSRIYGDREASVDIPLYIKYGKEKEIYYGFYQDKLFLVRVEFERSIEPAEFLEAVRKKYGPEVNSYSIEKERRGAGTLLDNVTDEEIYIWENDITEYKFSYLQMASQKYREKKRIMGSFSPTVTICEKRVDKIIEGELLKELKKIELRKKEEEVRQKEERLKLKKEVVESL